MCTKHHTYHIKGHYAVQEETCNDPAYGSDAIIYEGPNLPCSGVNTSDELTVALQKMDAKLLILQDALLNLTTTTTTTLTP